MSVVRNVPTLLRYARAEKPHVTTEVRRALLSGLLATVAGTRTLARALDDIEEVAQ